MAETPLYLQTEITTVALMAYNDKLNVKKKNSVKLSLLYLDGMYCYAQLNEDLFPYNYYSLQ